MSGRARGVAVHKSFESHIAQIAEVSRGRDGLPKVEHVWCAVDCGVAVNPDIIRAQMEGGIGFGLGAVLYDDMTLDKGRVVQSNFNDYRMLRINEMPRVSVVIVASSEKPTGVGEPGVPPIGPAVANAWRALTGTSVRHLPFARVVAWKDETDRLLHRIGRGPRCSDGAADNAAPRIGVRIDQRPDGARSGAVYRSRQSAGYSALC